MSTALMIDNWMLQDVASCLVNGLDDDLANALVVDEDSDTHEFKDVCGAGMRLEALIGLLGEIVLRDANDMGTEP